MVPNQTGPVGRARLAGTNRTVAGFESCRRRRVEDFAANEAARPLMEGVGYGGRRTPNESHRARERLDGYVLLADEWRRG